MQYNIVVERVVKTTTVRMNQEFIRISDSQIGANALIGFHKMYLISLDDLQALNRLVTRNEVTLLLVLEHTGVEENEITNSLGKREAVTLYTSDLKSLEQRKINHCKL